MCNVLIEDTSSDSWITQYRVFDKGEQFETWLKIKIETHTYIPTLTVENCADFTELVQTESSSPNTDDATNSFMVSHNGEYLEFDGTITHWYDEVFWVAVNFDVSVEDSEQLSFSWDSSLSDLKLLNDYHRGLITEGIKVHMIVKINATDSEWQLDIEEFQILE